MRCIVTGSEYGREFNLSDTLVVPLCDKAYAKLLGRLMDDGEHDALTERIKKEEKQADGHAKGLANVIRSSGVVIQTDIDEMVRIAKSDAKVRRLLLRRGIIAARHLNEMIDNYAETGTLA